MQQNVLLQHTKKSIKMWTASITLELKATTRTWRESGDWVALHNIMTRGSTHMSGPIKEYLKNYKRHGLKDSN